MFDTIIFTIYDKTLIFCGEEDIDKFTLDMLSFFFLENKSVDELELNDNIQIDLKVNSNFEKKLKSLCESEEYRYETFIKSYEKILRYEIEKTNITNMVKEHENGIINF